MACKSCFLSLVLTLSAVLGLHAQMAVGDWYLHSTFSGLHSQKIIDTGSIVYYVADGWLYSYNKKDDESVYYNKRNYLSDTDITNIYYNYDKDYLLITYSNSNIDLLHDNGTVDNIPDLKNAVMTVSKTINDIDFEGDDIYVATAFGFMIIDSQQCAVKDTYNYGQNMSSLIAVGDYLYSVIDDALYRAPRDANLFYFNSFQPVEFEHSEFDRDCSLEKIDDSRFFFLGSRVYRLTVNEDASVDVLEIARRRALNLTRGRNGFLLSMEASYSELDEEGTPEYWDDGSVIIVSLPEEVENCLLSSMESDGIMWGLDGKGIKQFIANRFGFVYHRENYRPNATTVSQPYFMEYKNNRLYMMSCGPNLLNEAEKGDGFDFGLASLQNGRWTDLAPAEMTGFVNSNSHDVFTDPYSFAVDPEDPDLVWFGSWYEGAFAVRDNMQVQKFDNTNAPLYVDYTCCVSDLQFDSNNNLWCMYFNYQHTDAAQFMVMPATRRLDNDIQKSDWITFYQAGLDCSKQCNMLLTRDDILLATDCGYPSKLFVLDFNGTLENKSDDRQHLLTSLIDQDGQTFDTGRILCFEEDLNGNVWIGTSNGVGIISNIESLLEGTGRVTRVKVPRNDGTNLADYLLDGQTITSIAVDGANRKWIGTTSSGVYLVSDDGSEIIDHFTLENSYLPDNNVISVECSTDDNTVYFGTKSGTVEYSSDAVQAESNYNNVYAYPNPVRPDYTGYITVTGLMDNSLVKIADTSGKVVSSGLSTGGMFVWDGCNSDGQPVKTGVYFVLASQSVEGGSDGCVTKILIVR